MVEIIFTPIFPKDFNIDDYLSAIKQAITDEMGIQKRMYEKTTRTWEQKTRFITIGPKRLATIVIGRVRPDKRFKSSEIFRFIDAGTKRRWAVMSKDFKPKTKNRVIGSSRGRGGAIVMGKRAMQKRGIAQRQVIKARKFTEEIDKRREKPFAVKVQKAIDKASKKVFP